MESITAAVSIADSVAFSVSGGCRLSAVLTVDQSIALYEENAAGDYEPATDGRMGFCGVPITLTAGKNSLPLELYGNYKCLASEAGLSVGIAS